MVIEQIKSGKGGVMVMPPSQGKIADAPAPQANAIFKTAYAEPMKMGTIAPQPEYAVKTGYTEPIKMIGTPAPNLEYAMKPVQNWVPVNESVKMAPQVDYAKGFMEPMKTGTIPATPATKVGTVAQGFMEPMKMGTITVGGQITPQGINSVAQGNNMGFNIAGGGKGAVAYS
jgi:hypothetical protein